MKYLAIILIAIYFVFGFVFGVQVERTAKTAQDRFNQNAAQAYFIKGDRL